MKKLIIPFLVLIGLADLGALYYLIQKQVSVEKQLRESLEKDIEERWQIAQSVQEQVQSKKQARDFIARVDSEKQMESYAQELSGYGASLNDLTKKSEERLTALEFSLARLDELTKQQESAFDRKIEDNKKEFSSSLAENEEALRELKELNNQVKSLVMKMEQSFQRKLESLEKKIISLNEELVGLKERTIPAPTP
jgi:glutaredoxin 2